MWTAEQAESWMKQPENHLKILVSSDEVIAFVARPDGYIWMIDAYGITPQGDLRNFAGLTFHPPGKP